MKLGEWEPYWACQRKSLPVGGILGEINQENISILQEADSIFIEELKKNDLYDEVSHSVCIFQ